MGKRAERQDRSRVPRRMTIRDVAEAASVSQSTASRALSGNGYVATAVKERVHQAAQRLGYVPDATAQDLRRRVSRTLGLVVSDLANPFYAELAAGATAQARALGYVTVLSSAGVGPDDETDAVRALVGLRVAGVIVTPSSAAAGEFLREQRIPLVEVDRQFAHRKVDAVVGDNVEAAEAMTTGLLRLGHRRIALVIDETSWSTGRNRQAGYRQALEAAGIRFDPALVVTSGWDVQAAAAAARGLLADPARPTAVFAANNVLAEGVWRAAAGLGLQIPEELSVVAFDDAPWMSMVTPPVSVVRQDVRAVGRAAVDTLLGRLAHPRAPVRAVVVPYELVERGSWGSPPAAAVSEVERKARATPARERAPAVARR